MLQEGPMVAFQEQATLSRSDIKKMNLARGEVRLEGWQLGQGQVGL